VFVAEAAAIVPEFEGEAPVESDPVLEAPATTDLELEAEAAANVPEGVGEAPTE